MRGCLTLVVGFALGAGLMLYWWPHPPVGASKPQPADIHVTLSNAYLARIAQRRASTLPLIGVQDVSITSAPPSLVAHARLSLGPDQAPASVQLHPVVANGNLRLDIVSAEFAGLPVPTAFIGALQDSIDGTVRRDVGSRAHVVSVIVTQGGLDILADGR